MLLVGIVGKAGSGKSTIARLMTTISGPGSKIIAIADAIKDIAFSMEWNGEKDEKGRKLLQSIGDVGRDYDSDTWIKLWKAQYDASYECDLIVVDDVRLKKEAGVINELGGVLVKVVGRGSGEGTGHYTEVCDFDCPIEFDNSVNLKEMYSWVCDFLEREGKHGRTT